MSFKVNKETYLKLINEDIDFLKEHCPNTQELNHAILIIENSVDYLYPEPDEPTVYTEDFPHMKFRIGDTVFDHREGRHDHFFKIEGYTKAGDHYYGDGDNYYGTGGIRNNGNTLGKGINAGWLIDECYALPKDVPHYRNNGETSPKIFN